MISDIDETIKQLLIKKGGLDPTEVDIVFDMPDREWSGSISKPTVNLYLYDIHENRELREFDWIEAHDNGKATMSKLPIRVDLSYLVTVWTNDTADQHRLLGHILSTLYRYPELPEDLLQGSLAALNYPVRTETAQPDGVLRNSADFWSALDNQLKPSISYVVTIPIDLAIALTAPEVSTKIFRFADIQGKKIGDMVQIDGIVRRKGKPDEVIPNATVVIKELNMAARANDEGKYAFHNLNLGSYTFEISIPEEKEKRWRLKVTVPSKDYNIEV